MRRGGSRPGVRVRERHLTRAGAAAGDAPRRLNRRGQSWHAEASRDRSSGHPLPSGLAEHIKAAHFEVFRTAGKAFQYKASSHLTTRRARFTGRRRADAAARDSSARGCTLARGVSSSRRAPPPRRLVARPPRFVFAPGPRLSATTWDPTTRLSSTRPSYSPPTRRATWSIRPSPALRSRP